MAKDEESNEEARRAYDTLWGYLQSVGDAYARAYLHRQLDILYEYRFADSNRTEDSAKAAEAGST